MPKITEYRRTVSSSLWLAFLTLTRLFPEPMKLEKRLKDVLEQDVDEKYYLSDKLVNYVFSNGGVNKNIQGGVNVSRGEGNAGAITANYYKSPRQGNYIEE